MKGEEDGERKLFGEKEEAEKLGEIKRREKGEGKEKGIVVVK